MRWLWAAVSLCLFWVHAARPLQAENKLSAEHIGVRLYLNSTESHAPFTLSRQMECYT